MLDSMAIMPRIRQQHPKNGRTSRKSRATEFLYRVISDDLRRRIRSGAIAPGARLPSLNELADQWCVNRLTAMKAIEELRDAGLVVSSRARGNFAAGLCPEDAPEVRSFTVGLLSRVLHPAGYGLYHQSMIAGLYDGLGPVGANLLVLAAGAESPSELPAMMQRARADAMIYMGAFEPDILAELLREGPPAVVLDFDAGDLPVDGIRVDNPEIGRLAMGHLLSLGVAPEELAILEGNPADLSSQRRLQGAEAALREAGADPATVRREVGWFMRDGGREAVLRLLAKGAALRGLYCMNDEMASGALEALREAGRRVPEDVRIVGTDDSLWARTAVPELTTVRIDARQMGSQAVRLLLKRIASPDEPFARQVLAPELVVRKS